MSREEFEHYVALLGRLLRLNSGEREAIRWELEDHMESRVAELEANGLSNSDATRRALEEFGDAARLARQFEWANRFQQRRWIMRFTVFSVVATFVVAVLLMSLWPQPARFGAPQLASGQEGAQEVPPQQADEFSKQDSTSDGILDGQDQAPIEWDIDDGVQDDPSAQPVFQPSASSKANMALEDALQNVSSMDYDETPLGEVLEKLASELNANVILDQSARDDALVEGEPISFVARDLPIKTALRLMLQEKNATYLIDDGVLRIISLDVAGDPRYMRRKIFDCRSIINRMMMSQESGSGATNNAGALSALDPGLEPRIAKMVTSTIAPSEWTHTNGDASFEMLGGMAIVVASEDILDEIQSLLQDFEFQLATSREPMTWRYWPQIPSQGTDPQTGAGMGGGISGGMGGGDAGSRGGGGLF